MLAIAAKDGLTGPNDADPSHLEAKLLENDLIVCKCGVELRLVLVVCYCMGGIICRTLGRRVWIWWNKLAVAPGVVPGRTAANNWSVA